MTSSTGEVKNATVKKPMVEVAAAEKPVKEKKIKATKEKKPKTAKTASHPPYFQMIEEAILALNDRSGSSPYAIAKYMEEKHKAVLPANFRKILGLQLKNSASKGKLIKVKASYKLSDSTKKDKVAIIKAAKTFDVKKPKNAKKPKEAKAKGSKKSETVKKAVSPVKKIVKKKKKAKQPKSIKSPAAKKVKSIKSPAAKKARKAVV
ncbi:hypothetical protein LguiB_019064 [Lonicera macranthoides]